MRKKKPGGVPCNPEVVRPMTSDGRAISPDVEADLNRRMEMVCDWLLDEMLNRRKAIDGALAMRPVNLARARDLQVEANCLLRMAGEARNGAFLPKDLRPCVDDAGNRGNHKQFVSLSPNQPDICAFCGRP